MDAWVGQILRVDLTEREFMVEELDPDFARAYIGGQGTATRILYDEIDPTVDGLDPENKLIFSTGAVCGTGGNDAIDNFGTIIGSIDLGGGVNALNNRENARLHTGPHIKLGLGKKLTNDGTLSPGGNAVEEMRIELEIRPDELIAA